MRAPYLTYPHRTGVAIRTSAVLVLALSACAGDPVQPFSENRARSEATALTGEELFAPSLPAEVEAEFETRLSEAREAFRADPANPDALIWLGRRTAYLGRYREAIEVFDRGVFLHPTDARFLRHRGHRFITLRRLNEAIADLDRAAELERGLPDRIEPDGLPNDRGIPTSTQQSNVHYHRGLAYFLSADFEAAHAAYLDALAVSKNPDMWVATSQWLYATLRRLGREAEAQEVLAQIDAELDIIENHDYHRLLLMARGEVDPEELLAEARERGGVAFASVGFGVGHFYLTEGRRDEANAVFEEVVRGENWAAFGHIAAEAEIARSRE